MIVFSPNNLIPDLETTLSIPSGLGAAIAAYPVANVRDGLLQPECRISPTDGKAYILADLGSAPPAVNRVRIAGHNISEEGYIKVYAHHSVVADPETAGGVQTAFSQVLERHGNTGVAIIAAPVTYRYWWLRLYDVSGPVYLRVGEWQLAFDTPFGRHPTAGGAADVRTWDVEEHLSSGGILWSYLRNVRRRWNGLSFERLTEEQFAELENVLTSVGYGGSFWFVLCESPDEEAQHTHFVVNTTMDLPRESAGPWRYNTSFSLAEIPEGLYVD